MGGQRVPLQTVMISPLSLQSTGIHLVSAGKLTDVTRSSHVWTTLSIAICNGIGTLIIPSLYLEVGCWGMRWSGAWYALGKGPETIA